jgi:hypothetical protein
MSAAPAARAGVVAVMDAALATATFVATVPPIETVAPEANPEPLIVIPRPPDVTPSEGVTAATAGAAAAGGPAGGCGLVGAAGDEPPHDNPNAVRVARATYQPV